MARQAHKRFTLPQLLADYSGEICDLTLELRDFIRAVVPEAHETIRWRGISYTRQEAKAGFVKSDICSLVLFEECVHIRFIHGAFLPDPERLLDADPGRKAMRFVKLRSAKDIPRFALRKLIRASLAFRPRA